MPPRKDRCVSLHTLTYKQLDSDDDISAFDCGSEEWQREVADFLREDALAQQGLGLNKTFLFYDGEDLVGYVSLLTWKLELEADADRLRSLDGLAEAADSGRRAFPALLVGQFGVSNSFQRKGYGSAILSWVRGHALELEVGVRFLVLHVERKNQQGKDFWAQQGFTNSKVSGSQMLFMWYDLLQSSDAGTA